MFEEEAKKYEVAVPITTLTTTRKDKQASTTSQYFEEAIFERWEAPQAQCITSKLHQYLGNKFQKPDINVSNCWK